MGSVVECILDVLEREGVGHVFGVPGGPVMPFYEALFRRGRIRPVLAKHEQGAAFMADGYARARRGLGACCATTGPGATNALTGVACAAMDSVPLFVLTAQVATWAFGRGAAQESSPESVDTTALYRAAAKRSLMLANPAAAARTVDRLLRCALTGRPGPVHLSLPADMARAQAGSAPESGPAASAASFDRAAVRSAARALVRARRPAILAGHGVEVSGAWRELRALAERLGIPVATSPKAKGSFPEDHPLSLGVLGFAGSPQARAYLVEEGVDVLLVAGSGLGEQVTDAWDPALCPPGGLLQIDIDPERIGRNYPAAVAMVGDARATLSELGFQVERELRWSARSLELERRSREMADFKARCPRFESPELMEDESLPLKPPRLMRELQDVLPEDALLFVDIGNAMAWAIHYLTLARPHSFVANMGFASMGHAVAAAVGGKLAAPERPVLCIAGDAAFAMNGFEVHTAVEAGAAVVWIILNNGGHGMVYHGERAQFGGKFVSSRFGTRLDLAGAARAMGALGLRVERPGELAGALGLALRSGRPAVIDAAVDLETPPPTARRFQTLNRFLGAGAPA